MIMRLTSVAYLAILFAAVNGPALARDLAPGERITGCSFVRPADGPWLPWPSTPAALMIDGASPDKVLRHVDDITTQEKAIPGSFNIRKVSGFGSESRYQFESPSAFQGCLKATSTFASSYRVMGFTPTACAITPSPDATFRLDATFHTKAWAQMDRRDQDPNQILDLDFGQPMIFSRVGNTDQAGPNDNILNWNSGYATIIGGKDVTVGIRPSLVCTDIVKTNPSTDVDMVGAFQAAIGPISGSYTSNPVKRNIVDADAWAAVSQAISAFPLDPEAQVFYIAGYGLGLESADPKSAATIYANQLRIARDALIWASAPGGDLYNAVQPVVSSAAFYGAYLQGRMASAHLQRQYAAYNSDSVLAIQSRGGRRLLASESAPEASAVAIGQRALTSVQARFVHKVGDISWNLRSTLNLASESASSSGKVFLYDIGSERVRLSITAELDFPKWQLLCTRRQSSTGASAATCSDAYSALLVALRSGTPGVELHMMVSASKGAGVLSDFKIDGFQLNIIGADWNIADLCRQAMVAFAASRCMNVVHNLLPNADLQRAALAVRWKNFMVAAVSLYQGSVGIYKSTRAFNQIAREVGATVRDPAEFITSILNDPQFESIRGQLSELAASNSVVVASESQVQIVVDGGQASTAVVPSNWFSRPIADWTFLNRHIFELSARFTIMNRAAYGTNLTGYELAALDFEASLLLQPHGELNWYTSKTQKVSFPVVRVIAATSSVFSIRTSGAYRQYLLSKPGQLMSPSRAVNGSAGN